MTPYRTPPNRIYFIKPVGMPGPVKIGCSADPPKRLLELSTWSPFPLEIVAMADGDFKIERNVHCCFADTHSHREWFHASDRLTAIMARIANGATIAEAIDLSDKRGNILSGRGTPSGRRSFVSWTEAPEGKLFLSLKLRLNHALRRASLQWRDVPEHIQSGIFDTRRGGTSEQLLGEIEAYIRAPYKRQKAA